MNIFRILFLILSLNIIQAQDFGKQWTGYFSYTDIRGISVGNNRIYAAAQNAIFEYDPATLTNLETDAINGLDGSEISTIHYSENFGLSIIGYESGLLQVVMDNN